MGQLFGEEAVDGRDGAMGERKRERALQIEVAVYCALIEGVGDDESGVRAKPQLILPPNIVECGQFG
jgi:hypothetical protein